MPDIRAAIPLATGALLPVKAVKEAGRATRNFPKTGTTPKSFDPGDEVG